MAGPWEKYAAPSQSGPWMKYGGSERSSALPAIVADRAKAAKAGTLEVSQDSADRQKSIDYANAPNLMGVRSGQVAAFQDAMGQAMTFGLMDEAAAGISSAISGSNYDATLSASREAEKRNAEENPKSHLAGTVTGFATNPVVRAMPAATTVRGAAAQGAAIASADAFGQGEGGAEARAKDAAKAAPVGALFGAGAKVVVDGASAMVNRMLSRSAERPTIEALYSTKNAAYKAVDDSGEMFSGEELKSLFQRAKEASTSGNFVKEADPQTFAALKTLKGYAKGGKDISLSQLDKIRQTLWARYNRGDEPIILDMIGAVDDLISARAGASAQMEAARLANSRYAKAQLLENAFHKARLETAATGSGGNILNKYRQAVTRIIVNPKEAKWFSQDELAIMERFVMGTDAENVLRRIGKLSPGGNGLMTALNVYAASVNPHLLAVTGVATGAKIAADRSAMRGSETILDAVSTGVIPQAARSVSGKAGQVGGGGAALVQDYLRGR